MKFILSILTLSLLTACGSTFRVINDHPNYAPYIGKTVVLTEDMCLTKAPKDEEVFTPYRLNRGTGACQTLDSIKPLYKPIEVLKQGTLVTILDARSHKIPSGHIFHLLYGGVYVNALNKEVPFRYVVGLESDPRPIPLEFIVQ